jgi:hypothetical protein
MFDVGTIKEVALDKLPVMPVISNEDGKLEHAI